MGICSSQLKSKFKTPEQPRFYNQNFNQNEYTVRKDSNLAISGSNTFYPNSNKEIHQTGDIYSRYKKQNNSVQSQKNLQTFYDNPYTIPHKSNPYQIDYSKKSSYYNQPKNLPHSNYTSKRSLRGSHQNQSRYERKLTKEDVGMKITESKFIN